MSTRLSSQSDFASSLAMHVALKTAARAKRFDRIPAVRKAAEAMLKDLEAARGVYGRQLKMIELMQKGITLDELRRKLSCSRRTVFRYLNELEAAGVTVELDGTTYSVDKSVASMLK